MDADRCDCRRSKTSRADDRTPGLRWPNRATGWRWHCFLGHCWRARPDRRCVQNRRPEVHVDQAGSDSGNSVGSPQGMTFAALDSPKIIIGDGAPPNGELALNTWKVVRIKSTGVFSEYATISMQVDNGAVVTSAVSWQTAKMDGIILGTMNMCLREFVARKKALSAGEETELYNYLLSKKP